MEIEGKEKKASIGKIVFMLIGVVVIALVICSFFLLDSKSFRFEQALIEEQYLKDVWNQCKKELKDGSAKEFEIKLNPTLLAQYKVPGVTSLSKLTYRGTIITNQDNFDLSINNVESSDNNSKIDAIKNKDTYALSIPALFEGYISMNDNNSKRVLEKLGLMSPDSPELAKEDTTLLDDGIKILKKYAGLAMKGNEDLISVEKKQEITINNKSMTIDEYKLSLGVNDVKRIVENVLKELVNDEEAICYIAKVVQKMYGVILEGDDLQAYLEDIQQYILETYTTIANAEYEEENEPAYELSVYSNNHQTVKTVFKNYFVDETELSLETIKNFAKLEVKSKSASNLAYKYTGDEENNEYAGQLNVLVSFFPVNVFELKVRDLADGNQDVRKIESLESFLLNEASDEELESFRHKLEEGLNKLTVTSEEVEEQSQLEDTESKIEGEMGK